MSARKRDLLFEVAFTAAVVPSAGIYSTVVPLKFFRTVSHTESWTDTDYKLL